MNICFITTTFPYPHNGGVERVTFDLIPAFQKEGHHVFVLSLEGKLPARGEQCCPSFLVPEPGHWFSQHNEEFFREVQKKNKLEIIIIQSEKYPAVILCEKALLPGVKVVSVFHTAPFTERGTLEDSITPKILKYGFWHTIITMPKIFITHWYNSYSAKKWEREKLRQQYAISDAFVTLSARFHRGLVRFLGISDKSKLHAIPNPLRLQTERNESIADKENLIIWVGRMTFSPKRPDRMIRIWERISSRFPDWRLEMIGDGDAKELLENYCSDHKIPRISFCGQLNPASRYARAKILGMTSSWEGWGLVLTEAMTYGCVPIAYNSYSSLQDIIQDRENGLVIKAFKEQQYISCLEWLMTHDSERNTMSQNAAAYVRHFGIDEIVQQWDKLFKQI